MNAHAGIRWGHPLFLDMLFLEMLAILPGAIGAAIATPFTLQPRPWLLNPTWASVYFSPVDAVWNVGRDPENFDFDLLSGIALATSLVPGFFGVKFATPTRLAYPQVSLANTSVPGNIAASLLYGLVDPSSQPSGGNSGGGGESKFKPGKDRFMSAYAGNKTDESIGKNSLFNYPRPDKIFHLGSTSTNDDVVTPHMADTGDTVYFKDGDVFVTDFMMKDTAKINIGTMGEKPSVADAGLIVFAAEGGGLGRGIFVSTRKGEYLKVVGESQDGHLDPNEEFIDLNGNNKYDAGEDFGGVKRIDINGQVGLNGAPLPWKALLGCRSSPRVLWRKITTAKWGCTAPASCGKTPITGRRMQTPLAKIDEMNRFREYSPAATSWATIECSTTARCCRKLVWSTRSRCSTQSITPAKSCSGPTPEVVERSFVLTRH